MTAVLIAILYGFGFAIASVTLLLAYIGLNTLIIGMVHDLAGHERGENLALDVVVGTMVVAYLTGMWFSLG